MSDEIAAGVAAIDVSEGQVVAAKIKAEAAAGVDEDFVRARVMYDLALKRAQGNHFHFTTLDFKNIQMTRSPDWVPDLAKALAENTTCTCLDLSNATMNDTALQKLVVGLAVPSRCPKLKKLCLAGNPDITKTGETMARGLCKLRPGLELSLDEGLDPNAEGFVCQAQLVEGRTAWWNGDLAVEGETNAFWCPDEVMKHAGLKTFAEGGERIKLERGFQGPNGHKYSCEHAKFELYHQTGSLVLLSLTSNEGVEV